jgi:hypothetical protein
MEMGKKGSIPTFAYRNLKKNSLHFDTVSFFELIVMMQEEDFVDLMRSYHDVPNIPLYLWYYHPFVLVVGIIKIGPLKANTLVNMK